MLGLSLPGSQRELNNGREPGENPQGNADLNYRAEFPASIRPGHFRLDATFAFLTVQLFASPHLPPRWTQHSHLDIMTTHSGRSKELNRGLDSSLPLSVDYDSVSNLFCSVSAAAEPSNNSG